VTLTVRVRAPGKVNLALRVGGRRQDGFHPVASVFMALSLTDEVTAVPGPPGMISCAVTGFDAAAVGPEADNLAVKAAAALRQRHGHPGLSAALTIDKRLPVAGGMAGGSADAAAALLACARLWGLSVTRDDLLELAAQLGSDVPFPLVGGCALGLGRGERLTSALCRGRFHWVLAQADRGLSTAAVYHRFDRLSPDVEQTPDRGRADSPGAVFPAPRAADRSRVADPPLLDHRATSGGSGPSGGDQTTGGADRTPEPEGQSGDSGDRGQDPQAPPELLAALAAGDAAGLAASLVNDLEPAALSLAPELRRTMAAGLAAGALRALISGSGPTVALLAADEAAAAAIAVRLSSEGVARRVLRVHGPAPGARVV
jgi:4-diphosphocytidyl-2-C-methyl-D-erythritol kinase